MGQAQSQFTGSDCGDECCSPECVNGRGYHTDGGRPDPITSVSDGRTSQDSSQYPPSRRPSESRRKPGDRRDDSDKRVTSRQFFFPKYF